MSEIEKLYKNAEIKKVRQTNITGDDYPIAVGFEDYPPFTAEKQLELIKLLTQQCDLIISHFREWEFIHFDGQESTQITGKDFTETFAKLINAYWENLTDKEKIEIKGILNG